MPATSATPQTANRRPRHGEWAALTRFLFAREGRKLWLGLVLAVVTALTGIGLLGLAGWFITATALAGLQVATALAFDVFMPSAGIRLLALGRTASRYGERLVTHDATLGTLAAMREQVLRGYAAPQAARRLQRRPARLLFRLTSDIDALDTPYLRVLVPAAATAGSALLAGVFVGIQQPLMGLGLFAWLLLVGWGTAAWLARRAAATSARRAARLESLRIHTADLVAGQVDLLMAGQLEARRARLAASDRQLAVSDDRLNRLETAAVFVQGLASAVALGAVLLGAAWLVETGQAGVAIAALLVLVTLAAVEPIGVLRRGALDSARARLAARRILPLIPAANDGGRLPEQPATAQTQSPQVGTGDAERDDDAVLAVNLAFQYPGAARPAFNCSRLRIGRGETVALAGASGAGKSTLLGLIAGELRPGSGQINSIASAWLTQHVDLFMDSVRGNLQLAAPTASDEQLWQALTAAGLADELRQRPEGLDSRLGEAGQGLSGGQMRRLALARLLLAERPLWLLDEPTEALDADTARDVLARLRERSSGHTLILSTHLRREARLADRLVLIAGGHITADLRRQDAGFEAAIASLRPD